MPRDSRDGGPGARATFVRVEPPRKMFALSRALMPGRLARSGSADEPRRSVKVIALGAVTPTRPGTCRIAAWRRAEELAVLAGEL